MYFNLTIGQVAHYLPKCNEKLKALSKTSGASLLYLWYDFVKSFIAHGAILNHYCRGEFYQLKGCERRKSLTYKRILQVYNKANKNEGIDKLEKKHQFNQHFKQFITRHWLYVGDADFESFFAFCNSFERLVIKPDDGLEGIGIRIIDSPKNEATAHSLFEELKRGNFIIEECLKQDSRMIFGNASVNTIRAHSIMDKNGNIHVLKCLLRAGVGNSFVDNYSSGGCVYELNPAGFIISPSLKKDGQKVFIHPGTDRFMLGFQVPNWEKVITGIHQAHKLIPECRFIGWDIAITDSGIELIEGNHNPDYELLEFFGTKGWWPIIKEYL